MKFQLPETLPATIDELNELADQARAEIADYRAMAAEENAAFTDEDADRLQYLLDSLDTIGAEVQRVTEAVEKRAELLARAEAATAPAETAETEDAGDDTSGGTDGDGGQDGGGAGDAGADVVAEAEQIAAEAAERQPVTASAKRPVSFAGHVATSGVPPTRDGSEGPARPWELLQSAPRYAEFADKRVTTAELAELLASVDATQPTAFQKTGSRQIGHATYAAQAIARLSRPGAGKVLSTREELDEAVERATSTVHGRPVNAEALVAAGGWCAPSEQLYDFCETRPAVGLLSLPEIPNPRRGGLKFPAEPDFSGLLNGFHFTEAELEATDVDGNPTAVKQAVEIPCPDEMIEVRLEAIGWYVKAGILQAQAWPELIRKFLDEFMVAHHQRVSRLTLSKMLAYAGAAKVLPTGAVLGATSGILNGLHIAARNIQIKRRVSTVEGVAPLWLRDVLRADLALRSGLDVFKVSDADVDAWLAVRGIYLQYEGTWQSLEAGKPGHLDTLVWPDSVDVLLYPAGAFVRSLNNVITLGVQYPMEQVQYNRYTHAFVEDSFLVLNRCEPAVLLTVPLCVNGSVGAREQIVCGGSGGGNGGDGPGQD